MSAGHRASRRVGADGRLVFAPTRVRVGPFGGIDERRQIARRLAVACPRVDFGVGPTDSCPRGARERPGAARCQRDIVLGGLREGVDVHGCRVAERAGARFREVFSDVCGAPVILLRVVSIFK